MQLLEEFKHELTPEIDLTIVRTQTFFKAADPPSWIAFLANAPWWVQGMAA